MYAMSLINWVMGMKVAPDSDVFRKWTRYASQRGGSGAGRDWSMMPSSGPWVGVGGGGGRQVT